MASIISAGTTSGTSLNLSGDTSGVLQLATNGSTTAVTIDTSQRVGIGTTTLNDTLTLYAASNTFQRWQAAVTGTASSDGFQIGIGSVGEAYVWQYESQPIIYATTNTERMRIDSSGNVGIGTSTTTDGGVTVTTSVTRDAGWDVKLALQSTGANDYPALFFSGCSSTSRYSSIVQTASTSGNDQNQITARIDFLNTSSTAGSIVFCTNNAVGTGASAERMRILSTGNILSLAGGSTTATGAGIAFPATQNASSDANTLDDYEEGTWTPTVYGSTSAGTTTYTRQRGFYTKIGRAVTATFSVAYSSATGTGGLYIGGLPFTPSGLGNLAEYYGAFMASDLDMPNAGSYTLYANGGSVQLEIYSTTDNAVLQNVNLSNENATIWGQITYFV